MAPISRSSSVLSLVDRAWNVISESAFKGGWNQPLARTAEAVVISLLQRIVVGNLVLVTARETYTFGTALEKEENDDAPKAKMRVVRDSFWLRLCTMSDLGFAEAYMYGEVECDDLVSVFQIFLQNKDHLSNMNSRFSFLSSIPQMITASRFAGTLNNSRANVSAHYDISNDMFAGFLSEDMTYSCAIFPDLDGDLGTTLPSDQSNTAKESLSTPLDPLYDAQMRKLHHIIHKLQVPPPPHAGIPTPDPVRILEIGSGWGSLSILLAQTYPYVEIDTLTLSSEQKVLAEKRIADAGLSERIHVHLMDYRNMPPEWKGRFARFVSVEMIENVGAEYVEKYWGVVDWALDEKEAVGVVQSITIPEGLFPGGCLPSLTSMISTLTTGAGGRFVVDSVSNIGPHYARTLREWKRRFLDRFDSVIAPALRDEFTKAGTADLMNDEELEVFKRKWIYYYCYCEVGFMTRTLGDHILTFTREGNQNFNCTVYN